MLHEHPVGATSWQLEVEKSIMKMEGVNTIVGDQCHFGLGTTGGDGKHRAARKRTRLMSNAPEVLKELGMLCRGEHEHQHLLSNRAAPAAVYPDGFASHL